MPPTRERKRILQIQTDWGTTPELNRTANPPNAAFCPHSARTFSQAGMPHSRLTYRRISHSGRAVAPIPECRCACRIGLRAKKQFFAILRAKGVGTCPAISLSGAGLVPGFGARGEYVKTALLNQPPRVRGNGRHYSEMVAVGWLRPSLFFPTAVPREISVDSGSGFHETILRAQQHGGRSGTGHHGYL